MPLLWIASSNPGKIAEVQLGVRLWQPAAAPSEPTELWTVEPIPRFTRLPPCEEDALTFAENARKKALHYSRFADGLVLADDSGLEVDALRGAPGIKSRRFAGPVATDADNNAKLLALLGDVPAAKRTARFVCELALARRGELLAQFRGVAEGLILNASRGEGGFGYDPLFLDPQSEKTFAELSPEEKLARSHRGRALRALLDWLATQSA
ncbi:MAG: non-canonical purine NTP pyrophosphatase, partial [Terriglobia bacterium]